MKIGPEIHKELIRQERSVIWFSRQLKCDRNNAYNIFKRSSIDTDLLLHISVILGKDFFLLLSNEIKGKVKR